MMGFDKNNSRGLSVGPMRCRKKYLWFAYTEDKINTVCYALGASQSGGRFGWAAAVMRSRRCEAVPAAGTGALELIMLPSQFRTQ